MFPEAQRRSGAVDARPARGGGPDRRRSPRTRPADHLRRGWALASRGAVAVSPAKAARARLPGDAHAAPPRAGAARPATMDRLGRCRRGISGIPGGAPRTPPPRPGCARDGRDPAGSQAPRRRHGATGSRAGCQRRAELQHGARQWPAAAPLCPGLDRPGAAPQPPATAAPPRAPPARPQPVRRHASDAGATWSGGGPQPWRHGLARPRRWGGAPPQGRSLPRRAGGTGRAPCAAAHATPRPCGAHRAEPLPCRWPLAPNGGSGPGRAPRPRRPRPVPGRPACLARRSRRGYRTGMATQAQRGTGTGETGSLDRIGRREGRPRGGPVPPVGTDPGDWRIPAAHAPGRGGRRVSPVPERRARHPRSWRPLAASIARATRRRADGPARGSGPAPVRRGEAPARSRRRGVRAGLCGDGLAAARRRTWSAVVGHRADSAGHARHGGPRVSAAAGRAVPSGPAAPACHARDPDRGAAAWRRCRGAGRGRGGPVRPVHASGRPGPAPPCGEPARRAPAGPDRRDGGARPSCGSVCRSAASAIRPRTGRADPGGAGRRHRIHAGAQRLGARRGCG